MLKADNLRKFSLVSHGLKYKLRIAFYLMSVLPILICIYLVSTYILPKAGLKIDITAIIAVSIFVALVGFFVIKEIFDRFISLVLEAKLIASGDLSRKLDIKHADEVGDLGEALNSLTQRIRLNMDELKNYSDKTNEINLEIQRRVLVLSSLLQISSLISQNAKLEDILKVTVEKSRLLANSDVAYLLFRDEGMQDFYVKLADGINSSYLLKVIVKPKDSLFAKAISSSRPLVVDKQNVVGDNILAEFYQSFRLKNTVAIPIYLRGRVIAILGIGNTKEGFLYRKDDSDLLDIFAKQVAIAVENDILMHRVEKLEIKDVLTGLYNATFMNVRLEEEIKRAIAYQRPCAFIVIDIDNLKRFYEKFGSLHVESALKKIASLIRDSVSEVDRVGRIGDDEFAVLLPERNKRQAQEIAEDIRQRIEFAFAEEPEPGKKITVSAGVSENPLDGISAQELFKVARESLITAKQQGKNRVVGIKDSTCR